MKKRWGVNQKALIGTIFYTLLFSLFTCTAGCFLFDRVIQKLYNDKGYVVANIILNDIDVDKVAEYTRTWEEDDYYHELEDYLHHIEEYSKAAYIYIAVPYKDRTMRYVYDTDTFIGDSDPISASFEEIWTAYTEGVRPKSYLVRHSKKYGYLTSSCLPVKDSTGQVVALLFVDTYMNDILMILHAYVINMIVISLVLLIVFSIINWKSLRKNFIKPMMLIRDNVQEFARSEDKKEVELGPIETGDEIEDLANTIHQMEEDIVQYIDNLQSITAEKERINVELNIAHRIQAAMLPRKFPPFPDKKEFEIYATMDPAKAVGGDFYDFFLIDDDHLGLVLADVAGKGIPAALFMAITKVLIKHRALMDDKFSTSGILRYVNNLLSENNDAEMFATVWMCIVELSTGKATISNCGHEHPAFKPNGGKFELKTYKHSMAVATFPNIKIEEHEVMLNPGDTIFVYTDGVAEATNSDEKLFGAKRMLESLNKEPDADVQKLLENVKADIDDFVGDAPQFDDITMLVFKYLG